MIDIRNQAGDALLLEADEPLVLEQAAGLLETDTLPGGFSYPLTFPLADCPQNARFVGQAHRPASTGSLELPVRITVEGGLYRQAVLSYKVEAGKGAGTLRLDYSSATDELTRLTLLEVLSTPLFLGVSQPGQLAARMQQISNLPPGTYPFTFFPLRNERFMEDTFTTSVLIAGAGATYTQPQYVNPVDPLGSFLVDSPTSIGRMVVPFFYLTWVVEQLLARMGYRMGGAWAAEPATRRLVILNMSAMMSGGRVPAHPDGSGRVSEFWVRPGQHLPDMSVGDFLKAIREGLGLFFRWDSRSKVCYVDRFRDLLTAPAVDLRGALTVGNASLRDASRQGYRVVEYVEGADELRRSADGGPLELPPLTYGNGKNEVKLRVGTCSMIREQRPDTRMLVVNNGNVGVEGTTWDIPALRLPGNVTDAYLATSERALTKEGKLRNPLGLLLLSAMGSGRDGRGVFYPYATPYPDGAVAQRLAGRNGAWLQGLRSVFAFRAQAKELAQELLLPVATAVNLLPGSRVQLRDPQGNEAVGLLDTIQAELPAHSGLVQCRLTTRLLPPPGETAPLGLHPTVYVELIQVKRLVLAEPITYPQQGYPAGVPCFLSRTLLTLTIKVWTSPARTQPVAVPGGLELMLRIKEINRPGAEATSLMTTPAVFETNQTVVTEQAQTLIDAFFEEGRLIVTASNSVPLVNRYRAVQLDPGPGYILL